MASRAVSVQQPIRFGDGYELDLRPLRLRRGARVLKLERIPLEILALLLEREGEVVRRNEIVSRVWGPTVFVDTDNSIRGAIRKLRQVLKDDAENPRFIETVTGQGYRFVARVVPFEEHVRLEPVAENPAISPHAPRSQPALEHPDALPAAGEPKPVAASEPDDEQPGQRSRIWLMLGATALLAVIAATGYLVTRHRGSPESARIHSLAVLPLKNLSGDQNQEFLADAMTEAIIGRLSTIGGLRVISRTSVMPFKQTRMTAPEIAKALRVDAIVEGSVLREGDRIRVHAQLIRGTSDEHLWSEEYDRQVSDVFALQSDVAKTIAEKIQVTISGHERSRLVAVRPVSPEVYESYLKGMYETRNTKAGFEKSITYFEDAIAKDPTFAPAYVGLAYAFQEFATPAIGGAPPGSVRPKVINAAHKALELDPTLSEPHAILAAAYNEQWEWTNAEREYKQALELNPNDALTHLAYARWLLCQGRLEEAQAWSRRGRELDPFLVSGGGIGWILLQSRRYDEAIRELRSDLAARPDNAGSYWFLGYALIAHGRADEAIPVLEKAAALSDRSPAVIGVLVSAYAQAGRRREALAVLEELKQRQRKGYVPAAAFVNAYLGLGDKEQVFAWLGACL